jgi:hypothetical protein
MDLDIEENSCPRRYDSPSSNDDHFCFYKVQHQPNYLDNSDYWEPTELPQSTFNQQIDQNLLINPLVPVKKFAVQEMPYRLRPLKENMESRDTQEPTPRYNLRESRLHQDRGEFQNQFTQYDHERNGISNGLLANELIDLTIPVDSMVTNIDLQRDESSESLHFQKLFCDEYLGFQGSTLDSDLRFKNDFTQTGSRSQNPDFPSRAKLSDTNGENQGGTYQGKLQFSLQLQIAIQVPPSLHEDTMLSVSDCGSQTRIMNVDYNRCVVNENHHIRPPTDAQALHTGNWASAFRSQNTGTSLEFNLQSMSSFVSLYESSIEVNSDELKVRSIELRTERKNRNRTRPLQSLRYLPYNRNPIHNGQIEKPGLYKECYGSYFF